MGVAKDLEKARKNQEDAERRLRDAEKSGHREQIQTFAELVASYANQVNELMRRMDKRKSNDSSSDSSDSSSSSGDSRKHRKRKSKKRKSDKDKERREKDDRREKRERERKRDRSPRRSSSRSRSPERRKRGRSAEDRDRKRPRHEGHGARPRSPSASSVSSREGDTCWQCGQRGHKKKDCPVRGRPHPPHPYSGPQGGRPRPDMTMPPRHPAPTAPHRAAASGYGGADGAVVRCLCCGALGHKAPSCPKRKGVQAPPNACYVCLQQGHLARDCPQRATGPGEQQAGQPPIAQPADYPLQGTWQ